MKFVVVIDARFEAEDIDEALALLALHFLRGSLGEDDSLFLPESEVEIKPE